MIGNFDFGFSVVPEHAHYYLPVVAHVVYCVSDKIIYYLRKAFTVAYNQKSLLYIGFKHITVANAQYVELRHNFMRNRPDVDYFVLHFDNARLQFR